MSNNKGLHIKNSELFLGDNPVANTVAVEAIASSSTIDMISGFDTKWSEAAGNRYLPNNSALTPLGAMSLYKCMQSNIYTYTMTITINDDIPIGQTRHLMMIVTANTSGSPTATVTFKKNGSTITGQTFTKATSSAVTGYELYDFEFTAAAEIDSVVVAFTHDVKGAVATGVLISGTPYTIAELQADLVARMNIGTRHEFDTSFASTLTEKASAYFAYSANNKDLSEWTKQHINPAKVLYWGTSGNQCGFRVLLDRDYTNTQIAFILEGDGTAPNPSFYLSSNTNTKYSIQYKYCAELYSGVYAVILNYGAVPAGSYTIYWDSTSGVNSTKINAITNVTLTDNKMIVVDEEYFKEVKFHEELLANKDYNISYIRGKKICVYGASIDQGGGYWERAEPILGATILNLAQGGGVATWRPKDQWPSWAGVHIALGWSCTLEEKEEAIEYNNVDTSEYSSAQINNAYDKSVLEHLDADLYVIGVFGGNDSGGEYELQGSLTIPGDENYPSSFPRQSIYGAIAHVLTALYTVKPTAKVIIMGSHVLYETRRKKAERCMARVAEDFGIPYLKWSQYFNVNDVNKLEYCKDTIPHFKANMTERVTQAILQIIQDIKPYMTNP